VFRKIARILLTFLGLLIWLLLALFAVPDKALNDVAVPQLVASSVSIIFSFINFFLLLISLVAFGNKTLIFSKLVSGSYICFIIIMFLLITSAFTLNQALGFLLTLLIIYVNHLVLKANIKARKNA